MIPLNRLLVVVGRTWTEWCDLPWTGVRFGKPQTAMLIFGGMLAVAVLTSFVRRRGTRRHSADSVMLPALLPVMRPSRLSATRHCAFALGLAGLLFFAVALADPYIASTTFEVAPTGRPIAVAIAGPARERVDLYEAARHSQVSGGVRQIDRRAAGRIGVRSHAARRPAFSGYALVAVLLWLTAATLKLTIGRFRTFP
jgi:hypothetical protein